MEEEKRIPFYELSLKSLESLGIDTTDKNVPTMFVRNRRDAFRALKVTELRGHEYLPKYFAHPTFCSFCNEFLWGFGKQGYQCRLCACSVHNTCLERVLTNCVLGKNKEERKGERFNINLPHLFKEKTFYKPILCNHCGQLILFKHGFKCDCCSCCYHASCVEKVPKKCGLDEKEMSDILSTLKRAKTTLRKQRSKSISSISTTINEPKLKSGSVSESLENIIPIQAEIKSNPEELEELKLNEIDKLVKQRIIRKVDSENYPHLSVSTETVLSPYLKYQADEEFFKSFKLKENKKISLKDFTISKLIGQGGFGKVFLVISKYNNKNCFALKALKKDNVLRNNEMESTALERDVCVLGNKNPYLTKLLASFQNEEYLFFLMEFLNGGDLMYHMLKSKQFSEDRSRFYAAEILCGLQFLHSEGIIHRDLKLDNILLDYLGHCKITDFGMCKKLDNPNAKTDTFCGTPEYIAPEILKKQKYGFSVDYWSYGVLIYEMLASYSPFYGNDEAQLYKAIQSKDVRYPDSFSEDSKSFIKCLLERDVNKRLGMRTSPYGNIRENKFFSKIDWVKLQNRQIEPPFRPKIATLSDTSNFDEFLTANINPKLSQMDKQLLKTIDEEIFKGFSFVSKELIS